MTVKNPRNEPCRGFVTPTQISPQQHRLQRETEVEYNESGPRQSTNDFICVDTVRVDKSKMPSQKPATPNLV